MSTILSFQGLSVVELGRGAPQTTDRRTDKTPAPSYVPSLWRLVLGWEVSWTDSAPPPARGHNINLVNGKVGQMNIDLSVSTSYRLIAYYRSGLYRSILIQAIQAETYTRPSISHIPLLLQCYSSSQICRSQRASYVDEYEKHYVDNYSTIALSAKPIKMISSVLTSEVSSLLCA